MSCHRLLQRGFARLYSYNLDPGAPVNKETSTDSGLSLAEYANSAVCAENTKDLYFKMKGARCLVQNASLDSM